MAAMMYAIKEQKGKLDPDRTMELLKNFKDPDSPREPISVDPATRDIVQNEYLREVRRVGGKLANVELETVGTAVEDPGEGLHAKKGFSSLAAQSGRFRGTKKHSGAYWR